MEDSGCRLKSLPSSRAEADSVWVGDWENSISLLGDNFQKILASEFFFGGGIKSTCMMGHISVVAF